MQRGQEMALAEAERNRWYDVLSQLVAVIQSLAERNMALRGSTETVNKPDNGNFLKEVELMAKFDPKIKQQLLGWKVELAFTHIIWAKES